MYKVSSHSDKKLPYNKFLLVNSFKFPLSSTWTINKSHMDFVRQIHAKHAFEIHYLSQAIKAVSSVLRKKWLH